MTNINRQSYDNTAIKYQLRSHLEILFLFQKMSTACCVCFETYVDDGVRCPKLLPCSHTICIQCLKKLVEEGRVQCPECREFHPVPSQGVHVFPTNRYVLENIELAERNAKLEGTREQTVYEYTVETIREPLEPSAPPIETTEVQSEAEICEVHSLSFELFCFEAECGRPLCASCRMDPKHRDHDFEFGSGQAEAGLNENSYDEGYPKHANPSNNSAGQLETVNNDGIALSAGSLVRITQDSFPSRNTKIKNKRGGPNNRCYRRKCCKCCAICFSLVFFWIMAAFLLVIFL